VAYAWAEGGRHVALLIRAFCDSFLPCLSRISPGGRGVKTRRNNDKTRGTCGQGSPVAAKSEFGGLLWTAQRFPVTNRQWPPRY
jgi:hypothetical protein